jgi:hypothetical protein
VEGTGSQSTVTAGGAEGAGQQDWVRERCRVQGRRRSLCLGPEGKGGGTSADPGWEPAFFIRGGARSCTRAGTASRGTGRATSITPEAGHKTQGHNTCFTATDKQEVKQDCTGVRAGVCKVCTGKASCKYHNPYVSQRSLPLLGRTRQCGVQEAQEGEAYLRD